LRHLAGLRDGDPLPEMLARDLQGWNEAEESLVQYLRKILEGADADLVVRMTKTKS
jgi:hypothetical protein